MILGLFACLETLMIRDGAEQEAWPQLSIPEPQALGPLPLPTLPV